MNQPNFDAARENMILNQLRSWGIVSDKILQLVRRYPRDHFVAPEFQGVAYADTMLPLEKGRVMLPPKLEAHLLQALDPGPQDHILEVGTGNGYLTALLAACAEYVSSVETSASLAEQARQRLKAENFTNVRVETGDASRGWPQHAPYDGILITAAIAPEVVPEFLDQLAPGGRLVGVVGPPHATVCVRITNSSDGPITKKLFEVELPYLESAAPEAVFEF